MEIEEIKKRLKNCAWNAQPRKKSKVWGIAGSSSLNAKTEKEAWNLWYNYCKQNGQVK